MTDEDIEERISDIAISGGFSVPERVEFASGAAVCYIEFPCAEAAKKCWREVSKKAIHVNGELLEFLPYQFDDESCTSTGVVALAGVGAAAAPAVGGTGATVAATSANAIPLGGAVGGGDARTTGAAPGADVHLNRGQHVAAVAATTTASTMQHHTTTSDTIVLRHIGDLGEKDIRTGLDELLPSAVVAVRIRYFVS